MSASRDKKLPRNITAAYEYSADEANLRTRATAIINSNYSMSGEGAFSRIIDDVSLEHDAKHVPSRRLVKFLMHLTNYFESSDEGQQMMDLAKNLETQTQSGNPVFQVTKNSNGTVNFEITEAFPAISALAATELKKYVESICQFAFNGLFTETGAFHPQLIAYLNRVPVDNGSFFEQLKTHYGDAKITKLLSANVISLLGATPQELTKLTTESRGLTTFYNNINLAIIESTFPQFVAIHVEQNKAKLTEAKNEILGRENALFILLREFISEQTNIIKASKSHSLPEAELMSFLDEESSSGLTKHTTLFPDNAAFNARYANNPAFQQLKRSLDALEQQKAALDDKSKSLTQQLDIVNRISPQLDDDIKTMQVETETIKLLKKECDDYELALNASLRPVMDKAAAELEKRLEKMKAQLASNQSKLEIEKAGNDHDGNDSPRAREIAASETAIQTLQDTLYTLTQLNLKLTTAAEYIDMLSDNSGLNLDKATREGFVAKISAIKELQAAISPTATKTNAEKLVNFNAAFASAEQTLAKNLDPAAKKFLSAVKTILKTVATLGIYAAVRAHKAKKKTGTARFWKTPEQIAAQDIKNSINRDPDAEPSTKKPKRG